MSNMPDMEMNKTEQSMLPSLLKFFSDRVNFDILKEFKMSKHSKFSVGLLNWFNVNYAKEYGVEYTIETLGRQRSVYVWQSYNAALSGYKKEYFDPFARGKNCGKEIAIEHNGEIINTTIRQLNYFRWAINNGVIDYVRKHVDEIYDDMINRIRRGGKSSSEMPAASPAEDAAAKKRQISVSASKKLGIHSVTMTVKFGREIAS
jgi:hypothetical protein